MLKKLRKLKLGYISIEVVILASIILVSGFSFLGAFIKNGQLASNDAANKIDSVLDLAGGGSGELPGGGLLPGGGSLSDDFPIEWNTKEASENVSFTLALPDAEDVKLVKIANFLPTEEQLSSAVCMEYGTGEVVGFDLCLDLGNGLILFAGDMIQGFVVKDAGEYDYMGICTINASEPGVYVVDLYAMANFDTDLAINLIKPQENLPTDFPVAWNTIEVSNNASIVIGSPDDYEYVKLVKVGDFVPSEANMRQTFTKIGDENLELETYMPYGDGLAYFEYYSDIEGLIAAQAGTLSFSGLTIEVPEAGLYVIDYWTMMGENNNIVIDAIVQEDLPTDFPIRWNTAQSSDNIYFKFDNTRFIKIGSFVPTKDQLKSTKLIMTQGESVNEIKAAISNESLPNGVTVVKYGELSVFVIDSIGLYEMDGGSFYVSEPGVYAVDMWGEEELNDNFTIEVIPPIVYPSTFPVEWNSKDVSENALVDFEYDDAFVKVSALIPTAEQMLSSEAEINSPIHGNYTAPISVYHVYTEDVVYFNYDGVVRGYIVKKAGYNDYVGAEFPEPGIYVTNAWVEYNEDNDYSIRLTGTSFAGSGPVPGLYQTGALDAYMSGGADAIEGMLVKDLYELIEDGVLSYQYGYICHIVPAPRSIKAVHCELQGDLILPNNGKVTGFVEYTFENCNALTGILIPDGVERLRTATFESTPIQSIYIPKSVKEIGWGTFESVTTSANIYYQGSEEEWNLIYFDPGNDNFLNANIHFNSIIPED